jgi:hypothetical protein
VSPILGKHQLLVAVDYRDLRCRRSDIDTQEIRSFVLSHHLSGRFVPTDTAKRLVQIVEIAKANRLLSFHPSESRS